MTGRCEWCDRRRAVSIDDAFSPDDPCSAGVQGVSDSKCASVAYLHGWREGSMATTREYAFTAYTVDWAERASLADLREVYCLIREELSNRKGSHG